VNDAPTMPKYSEVRAIITAVSTERIVALLGPPSFPCVLTLCT
jgi:hypothetical protein